MTDTPITKPKEKGNKTNGTEKASVKRPRALTFERLDTELGKQPLADKVRLIASLKQSIQADKKSLQEQLSLIEGTGND